jgi:TPR repeat protein
MSSFVETEEKATEGIAGDDLATLLHIRCRNSDPVAFHTLQYYAELSPATIGHEPIYETILAFTDPNYKILVQGYYVLTCYVCELEMIPCELVDQVPDLAAMVYPLLRQLHRQEEDMNRLHEKKNAALLFLCGIFEYYGLGCPKDVDGAVGTLQISADHGFALAQCCLGNYFYSLWFDDPVCGAGAFELYSLSAGQSYSVAQYNLGLCYENGCGTDPNPVKSLECYRLSAKQGNVSAQYHLGTIYESGEFCSLRSIGGEALQNLQVAFDYYSAAAENGLAIAQFNMGICHEYGLEQVTEKNLEKATAWYRRSAQQRHPPSEYTLGHCYEFGKGADKDLSTAVAWYLQAASHGHLGGQLRSGWCYQFGQGVPQSLQEAQRFYEMIAESNANDELYVKTVDLEGGISFAPNQDSPQESGEDRVHRALGLRNLAECLEQRYGLLQELPEGQEKEHGMEQQEQRLKQLTRVLELYLLAEYLLSGDKRLARLRERRVAVQELLKDAEYDCRRRR